ncbi:hypothetical protein SAMN05421853_1061 [Roseivivax halotolerans]|uniref:Uncharacterized protein n=1 Tax=Roseivivax halotolerans TaxID=93684 RepID=A0A1I5YKG1_9RHOB|nr:hypothetical protein SAMN05421853_1061 [Roseivivax halotolerans]
MRRFRCLCLSELVCLKDVSCKAHYPQTSCQQSTMAKLHQWSCSLPQAMSSTFHFRFRVLATLLINLWNAPVLCPKILPTRLDREVSLVCGVRVRQSIVGNPRPWNNLKAATDIKDDVLFGFRFGLCCRLCRSWLRSRRGGVSSRGRYRAESWIILYLSDVAWCRNCSEGLRVVKECLLSVYTRRKKCRKCRQRCNSHHVQTVHVGCPPSLAV